MATLTQGTTGLSREVTIGLNLQLAICKAEDILTNVLELAQEKFNLVTEALRLRIQNEEYMPRKGDQCLKLVTWFFTSSTCT